MVDLPLTRNYNQTVCTIHAYSLDPVSERPSVLVYLAIQQVTDSTDVQLVFMALQAQYAIHRCLRQPQSL
jgi:hypothetical protein